MKKKKSLWSGVSILIVAALTITAFIRGNAQLWLLAAAFTAWSVWAVVHFLVPYIKEQLHKYEARRIRKKCERQDARESQISMIEETDPVNHILLRHVNFRISGYLQSIYPDATWEWCEEFPEQIVAGGGTGRIKLFGVPDFNYADVTFTQNADIRCALMNVVPLVQYGAKTSSGNASETAKAPQKPNPVDPQVWYEMQGRKVLKTLITDLHSRGHSSLTIRENGDIVIRQADSEMVKSTLESVPEKTYWAKLCKVFEREGMAADITDGGILLSW
ncbi:MAG: hypothetical protein HFE65_01560 [Clostridiales bacterium]|nr:hypothetical protein [Clostridiales bacterium]